jgi:hypothetical protein
VDLGSNSTFEQYQGRLNWNPSERLSLNLNGGIEVRQFIDLPGSDDLINPLMGASIMYRMFDFTTIHFSADRSVGNSFVQGSVTEATTLSGGISQRLLGHLNLNLSAGYRKSDYRSTFGFFNQIFESVRRDDYSYVSTSLGARVLKKADVSVGYTHTRNSSTLAGFSYESNQFTAQVAYRF